VPSALVFLDALPLSPNGKVDRKALPAYKPETPETETTFVAPANEIERLIADVWREVLGLERVGVRDRFFDLGGNSIQIVRVHARLRDVLGRDVPLIELFNQPTIRSLADSLARFAPEGGMGAGARDRREGLERLRDARLSGRAETTR
jgi:hypothetical protein